MFLQESQDIEADQRVIVKWDKADAKVYWKGHCSGGHNVSHLLCGNIFCF